MLSRGGERGGTDRGSLIISPFFSSFFSFRFQAYKGESVAVKIQGSSTAELQKAVGRHFDETDTLYSRMSRRTIDILKENYRQELSKDEWKLVVHLKKVFDIQ